MRSLHDTYMALSMPDTLLRQEVSQKWYDFPSLTSRKNTPLTFFKLEKYKKGDFGKCPRVMCEAHPLLPMGLSDNPNTKAVKLYCGKCEDVYNPKSSRHSAIDGAYFGTSFHNILFQVYPALIPSKSTERYVPRIYGFKVHAPATLIRWQHGQRDEMRRRLRKLDIDSGFKDDGEELEAEETEEEEDEEVEMEGAGNGKAVAFADTNPMAGGVSNQI